MTRTVKFEIYRYDPDTGQAPRMQSIDALLEDSDKMLLDALNRHRGKGQQKVTVEHVHVHAGGQAVVGMVGAPGGGGHPKLEEQPHAKQIEYAPLPPMWSADQERERVPIARDAERPVSTSRRRVAGRSQG